MSTILRFDPGLRELRAASVLIVTALVSFGSALGIQAALGVSTAMPVLAVVLALSVGRTQRGTGHHNRLASLVRLPAVAIVAGLVGWVMRADPPVGDTLFVAGLSGAIWVRRFGPQVRQIGRLVALPLVAILVTPVPAVAIAGQSAWVGALGAGVIAVVAGFWVTVIQFGAARIGWLDETAAAPGSPAAGRRKGGVPTGAGARRITPSTRMAVQLATALTAAFVIGQWISASHWGWVVFSAFVVSSGNRGRGDVVWKGLLRLTGAAAGTLLATGIGQAFAPGDRRAIAAIFVLLLLATWLRAINYAFWAAGITAVLAILYDYYGESGPDLLPDRLAGILLGAVIAVAAAWLVLPVRTGDVARRRCADALAALSDLLAALRTDRSEAEAHNVRFLGALEQFEQIAPPLRAYRWLHRTRPAHLADALDALARCAAPLRTLLDSDPDTLNAPPLRRGLGSVRMRVGSARRALAGRPEPEADETPTPGGLTATGTPATADASPAVAALAVIGTEMATVRVVWLAFPRRNTAAGSGEPPRTPEPPLAAGPTRAAAPRSDVAPA
jgi:hypothetical protein